MIEWISIKDRIPTVRKQYLVRSESVFNRKGTIYIDKFNPGSRFDTEIKNTWPIIRVVTHWAEINYPEGV